MDPQIEKKQISKKNLSLRAFLKEVGRNAYVDWLVVVFITILIIVVLIIGGFYLYNMVIKGVNDDESVSAPSTSQVFDVKSSSLLIKVFDKKAEKSAEAKRGYSGPSDPSL